jgi:hypothetical protein
MPNSPKMISEVDDYLMELEQSQFIQDRLSTVLSEQSKRSTPSLNSEYPIISKKKAAKIKKSLDTKILTGSGVGATASFGIISPILGMLSDAVTGSWSENELHENDLKAYNFEQMKSTSTPGEKILLALNGGQAHRFNCIVDFESSIAKQSDNHIDFTDTVLLQTVGFERFFNYIFSSDLDVVADHIFSQLEIKQVNILERSIVDKKQTFGSLHILCIGLHRSVRDKNKHITDWVDSKFQKQVSRYNNENETFIPRLSTGNLARYLGRTKDKYRNPCVHPAPGFVIGHAEYQKFCDLSYGTKNLRQWLDLGVNPDYYTPSSLGWISFLATALKPPKKEV